ncbi:uncharacterized protein LOC144617875 [Crassostrea virginica]
MINGVGLQKLKRTPVLSDHPFKVYTTSKSGIKQKHLRTPELESSVPHQFCTILVSTKKAILDTYFEIAPVSLQSRNHRVCVKEHRKNPETLKIIPRRDRTPRFEIPGSANAKI